MVMTYVGIIVIPCTMYLYLAHADWMWQYLVDQSHIPHLAVVPVLAANAAALLGAYYGMGRLLRSDRYRHLSPGVIGGGGVFLAGLTLIARPRLFTYGTYDEYHAGRALPLLDVKLGYVLIAMITGVLGATAFVAWELWRDGRRVAATRDTPSPRVP
jgi:hypothetical protein